MINPFICEKCGATFKTYPQFRTHNLSHITPPTPPTPTPTPFTNVITPSISDMREQLELRRLELEMRRLEKAATAIDTPTTPAVSPVEQVFTLMEKIEGLIDRKLQARESLKGLVEEGGGDFSEQLALKALEAFIANKANTPTTTAKTEVGVKKEGLAISSATPPTIKQEEVKMPILPNAEELAEYHKLIRSGAISKDEAWADFAEDYPDLVKIVPREKFDAEYDKIKNS